MTKILLNFSITLQEFAIKFSPRGPLFHRYLPDGKNDEIILNTGDPNFVLKVWFERRGFVSSGMIEFDYNKKEVDPTIIPKQGILDAGPLSCRLEINGVSQNQFELIRDNKIGDPEFIKLGKEIVGKIVPALNNFLGLLRVKYGQYWIRNLAPFDSRYSSIGGYCDSLQMKCSLDDGQTWNEFTPDQPVQIFTTTIGGNFHYYLSEVDWKKIKSEANEKLEPSVAMNSLVQACEYMDQDDLKHAIIEGVTSMELAIDEFFQKKLDGNGMLLQKLAEFKQLHLPTKITMLAAAVGIPAEDLKDVSEIIDIRNDIAHRGIRPEQKFEVEKKLRTTLNVVSILTLDIKYRFPKANHGNAVKPIEEWEKI